MFRHAPPQKKMMPGLKPHSICCISVWKSVTFRNEKAHWPPTSSNIWSTACLHRNETESTPPWSIEQATWGGLSFWSAQRSRSALWIDPSAMPAWLHWADRGVEAFLGGRKPETLDRHQNRGWFFLLLPSRPRSQERGWEPQTNGHLKTGFEVSTLGLNDGHAMQPPHLLFQIPYSKRFNRFQVGS